MIVLNLVAPKAAAKQELLFNKPVSGTHICSMQLNQLMFLSLENIRSKEKPPIKQV
jgi:hypothetical protein